MTTSTIRGPLEAGKVRILAITSAERIPVFPRCTDVGRARVSGFRHGRFQWPLRLTPETAGLLNARAFATMKPTAFFVNTARGEVVDEAALIEALLSKSIAGAALDTYAEEPLPAASVLRRLTNVVLSPHVAGQTEAALTRVARCAAESILDEFAGRRPRFVYNPEAYEVRARGATAGNR